MKRKSMGQKLRFSIFERDSFMCQYCGRTPDKEGVVLNVDHIISVKNGGGNDKNNLLTACFDCNIGKGAKTTIKGKMTPSDIKIELEKTQEKLEQVIAMNKASKKIASINNKIDKIKYLWLEGELEVFNPEVFVKLRKLIEKHYNDVPREKILEAVSITKNKHNETEFDGIASFIKYFGGVLNNILLGREEQDIIRVYNNFLYSKSCKMYTQTKKFILENSFLGEDFHRDVVASIEKNIITDRGKSFKVRDEVKALFNRDKFTIYNQSDLNLNIHICDTIQMFLDRE